LKCLEGVVVDALKSQLADPRLLVEYLKSYHEEWRAEAKRADSEAAKIHKRLADVEASIMRYVNALERGSMPEDIIVDRLQKLEAERVGLKERQRLVAADVKVVDLHPAAIERYRRAIEELQQHLQSASPRSESRQAFRNLVDSVVVQETPKRAPYAISVYGRLGALLGIDLFPTQRKPSQIAAEHGVSCDNGNPEKSVSS
jgi:chromosome segregation ATPase